MLADSSGMTPLLRMQRKNYFIGSAALVVGLLLHCGVTRSWPVTLVLFQGAWALTFVLMGMGLGSGRLSLKWTGSVAAAIAFVGLTGFVLLSGGHESPYFTVFVALPFIQTVYSPDSRLPTALGGASSLLAILLINELGGVPLPRQILSATSFCTFLGLALYGTRMYRHMLDAHLAAHVERLAVLERLAESERLRGQAERERAEVERLVLVGQLAAGVAHEVNNPLAYVKANLNYLQRETRGAQGTLEREELEELLEETQQGVLRIQQIVEDLRGFSRADTTQEERGELESAFREARRLASVRLGAGGEVTLDLAPELPPVRLGQRHLVQVLVNLLLNAVDAVESARPARAPRIRVSAGREPGGVHVRVEDNGPGIPAEVLPRLFEPFFTTKPPGKGTGLGLALCRDYVARIGGSLHAESHPEGARFLLQLPLAPPLPVCAPVPRNGTAPDILKSEAVSAPAVRRDYAALEGSGGR